MPTISTFLTFNTQAEDAARFYTSIFPNSSIGATTRYSAEVAAQEESRAETQKQIVQKLDAILEVLKSQQRA